MRYADARIGARGIYMKSLRPRLTGVARNGFAAFLRSHGGKLRWFVVLVGVTLMAFGAVIPVACSRQPSNCGNGAACEPTKGGPDAERGPAADRKHAGRLLDAAQQCEDDMHSAHPPAACYVVVSWEQNRKIPYQDAIDLANKLMRQGFVNALSAASDKPWAPYSLRACNWYLGALGAILDIPYFRDRAYDGVYDEKLRNADKMNEFLAQAVKNPDRSGWKLVGVGINPGSEVTDLANQGQFVVASSHSIPGRTEYGHIAIAAPDYLDKESDPAVAGNTGPWIRYSVYKGTPHTTKSTKTSAIFGTSVTEPIWVQYVGKDWLVPSGQKKLPCVDLNGDGICDDLPGGGIPPSPTYVCVECPPGYHCGHNPERCIPNATTPVTTKPSSPPVTTKPSTPPVTTPPVTTKPSSPPVTTKPTTPPVTTPPTTTQHPA
ncbi:hypothetical protein [Mycobacterium innocens]|nr:hypothetical protein [Mycobacterium innocens]